MKKRNNKQKFRVKPVVRTSYYEPELKYVVQEKMLLGWWDISTPDSNKDKVENICQELNEFYES